MATSSIPDVQNLIAVSSGKGGVGKSTSAVNLAISLSLEGKKVGLLDADIYGPNIPGMMGVVDSVQVVEEDGKEYFIPPESYGVKVMSMGFLADVDQPLIWRGPMLHSVIQQFLFQVKWGSLDYLIFDLPPGTGDVQISLSQMLPLDGALLVTTPQAVAVEDVCRAVKMWQKVRVPILGVIENMSGFYCEKCDLLHKILGEGGGDEVAKLAGASVLARIPIDRRVREGADEGKPFVLRYPDSQEAKAFAELARYLVQNVKKADGSSVEIGSFS